jgi:hypothetical protein
MVEQTVVLVIDKDKDRLGPYLRISRNGLQLRGNETRSCGDCGFGRMLIFVCVRIEPAHRGQAIVERVILKLSFLNRLRGVEQWRGFGQVLKALTPVCLAFHAALHVIVLPTHASLGKVFRIGLPPMHKALVT